MIIFNQSRNSFYNWNNISSIYISRISKTEILLEYNTDSDELIGSYKNEKNAAVAFKKLAENILAEIPIIVAPTDEQIEEYIRQEQNQDQKWEETFEEISEGD